MFEKLQAGLQKIPDTEIVLATIDVFFGNYHSLTERQYEAYSMACSGS